MTAVGHRRESKVSRIEAAFVFVGGGQNNLQLRESERRGFRKFLADVPQLNPCRKTQSRHKVVYLMNWRSALGDMTSAKSSAFT